MPVKVSEVLNKSPVTTRVRAITTFIQSLFSLNVAHEKTTAMNMRWVVYTPDPSLNHGYERNYCGIVVKKKNPRESNFIECSKLPVA